MDVGLSEEQTLLREGARDFLARECPSALVRAQMDDPRGLPESLWRSIAELGWLGLIVPGAHGGHALGLVDLAVLLEEMGRVLCPVPFVSTAVVGAIALRHGGSPDQQARWLPRLVSGDLRIALAQLEEDADWGPSGVRLRAEHRGDRLRVDGVKCFVADAPAADQLLVAVRSGDPAGRGAQGISVVLVDADHPGVRIRRLAYNDRLHAIAEVCFDGVEVERDRWLGEADHGWPVLERAHAAARVAVTADLAGASDRVLALSVDHAKTREQFGQPIGRFQAVQHKCVDMLVGTEGIRSAAWAAAWAIDHGEPDAPTRARLAKAYASETALAVAGAGIQIHGGLGFTWEQDLHLYYKHAQASLLAYGSPTALRSAAADDLLGPATTPS